MINNKLVDMLQDSEQTRTELQKEITKKRSEVKELRAKIRDIQKEIKKLVGVRDVFTKKRPRQSAAQTESKSAEVKE